jgi:hypothetical protein
MFSSGLWNRVKFEESFQWDNLYLWKVLVYLRDYEVFEPQDDSLNTRP